MSSKINDAETIACMWNEIKNHLVDNEFMIEQYRRFFMIGAYLPLNRLAHAANKGDDEFNAILLAFIREARDQVATIKKQPDNPFQRVTK